MLNHFSNFHKKTIQERMQILKLLYPEINGAYTEGIDLKNADLMIENCIGKISLPVGLGLNFLINSKEYVIPMATEEPSIIAAASSGAKFIKENGGGFTASSTAPIMLGQIQVIDINPEKASHLILANKQFLIKEANTLHCPRMVSRGGGVIEVDFVGLNSTSGIVEISVNVCEAMGANIVNSICEGLAPEIQRILNCRTGLKILSNYCTERRTSASFKVPISKLGYRNISGEDIARGFMESYEFARLSIYRACTHNKGILNGIQAVAIATGQDTRALEAAAHTWASKSGKYQPLNSYLIKDGYLHASIEMPIAVGTMGGALKSNPAYQAAAYMLGNPSSSELSEILSCIGLACNFSAIRAMISEGIQKGHMGLHGKNIAIAVGVPGELVTEVVDYMKQRGNITQQAALEYLAARHLHTISRKFSKKIYPLNTFYANLSESNPPLKLSIAFHCPNIHGVHISIDKTEMNQQSQILKMIFSGHSYSWIVSFLSMLNKVKFRPKLPRINNELQIKIKFICIWLNEISINIIKIWGHKNAEKAFNAMFEKNDSLIEQLVAGHADYIEYGVYLELELWHILCYHLNDFNSYSIPYSDILVTKIKEEMELVIRSNIVAASMLDASFDDLLKFRQKQMSATLMYLCDCIGEAQITLDLIHELTEFGNSIEIISSAIRDYNKVIKKENFHPNLYSSWIANKNSSSDNYFQHIQNLISTKSLKFYPEQTKLLKKIEKYLNLYYNVTPKI